MRSRLPVFLGSPTDRLAAEIRTLFDRPTRSAVEPAFHNIDPYSFLRVISRGPKGTVYLALDRREKKRVAIKALLSSSDLESRRRFLREAECAANVKHPNVVAVHETIRQSGTDLIVMEHIDGKTLDRVVPKSGLSIEIFLSYALQIARAVEAIHEARIVHRDIKPANIVVSNSGIVKIIDFGLAKAVGQPYGRALSQRTRLPETRNGTILGTPGYMSPEQVRGSKARPASDIFSLGAVFYEMLTGHRAFHEQTPIETMGAILKRTPPRLPLRVPFFIRRIVRRCLAKEPRNRYTAGELIAALNRPVRR